MSVHRLFAALLALWIGSAAAGAFAVNPVRVALGKGRSAGVVTVQNQSAEPAVLQLEVMEWSQHDGIDQLTPTRDLIATPPIFKVAGNGSQIVRVGLRVAAPDAMREVSYRLILKEVPQPTDAASKGIRVMLQISLPVFIEPLRAMPSLRWEARYDAGQMQLKVFNEGNVHTQVVGLSLPGAAHQPEIKIGYVLPGQQHEWRFAADTPPAGPLPIVARTDAGEVAANVSVVAP